MSRSLAGTRIRDQRRKLGLKQSTLAASAEISASYLNLIEHNKRSVAGRVLTILARELGVSVTDLIEGPEAQLVEELRFAATEHAEQSPELDNIEELIGRFPGWAGMCVAQSRQIREDEAALSTFMDRQNFDPHLQETLHEMLTTITSIRSTSGILTTEAEIDIATRTQFQETVHSESKRLSEAAQDLVAYFDQAEETTRRGTSSLDAFEAFLASHDHSFQELEGCKNLDRTIAQILSKGFQNASPETLTRAETRLRIYASDAQKMPLQDFLQAAKTNSYAPDYLANHFKVDAHAAFRRLATLPKDDGPRFGLVIVNAAGQPMYRRPLEDFSLPRFSSICALWPVFKSLSTPGQPISELIELPNGREFLARAITLPQDNWGFAKAPVFASGMLVTSLNDAHQFGMIELAQNRTSLNVGTSCRLCQVEACPARSEPSLLPG